MLCWAPPVSISALETLQSLAKHCPSLLINIGRCNMTLKPWHSAASLAKILHVLFMEIHTGTLACKVVPNLVTRLPVGISQIWEVSHVTAGT